MVHRQKVTLGQLGVEEALAQDRPDLPRPATEGAERAGRSGPTRGSGARCAPSSDCSMTRRRAPSVMSVAGGKRRRCGAGAAAARGRRACLRRRAASSSVDGAGAPRFRQAQHLHLDEGDDDEHGKRRLRHRHAQDSRDTQGDGHEGQQGREVAPGLDLDESAAPRGEPPPRRAQADTRAEELFRQAAGFQNPAIGDGRRQVAVSSIGCLT